jgi:hypothetical protein
VSCGMSWIVWNRRANMDWIANLKDQFECERERKFEINFCFLQVAQLKVLSHHSR